MEERKKKTVYMDGGANFSYGEMLYGPFGFRNKEMYCKSCNEHVARCECPEPPKHI